MSETTLECAYCPRPATTEDHVPPQSWYSGNTRAKITVPACSECNSKFAKDDEFVKTFLVIGSPGSPVAREILDSSVTRALEVHSPRLRRKIRSQIDLVDIVRQSGIYAGREPVLRITDADWHRISKTLIRIVRGLYYHGNGRKLPSNQCYIVIGGESDMARRILTPAFIADISRAPTIGFVDDKILRGKILRVEGSDKEHIWILQFYNTRLFVVVSYSEERARSIVERNTRRQGSTLIS